MSKNVELRRARIFLVLTAMTIFLCCQKDDASFTSLEGHLHEHLQTTTKNVSLDEIPEVSDYLSTLGDHKGNFIIEKSIDSNNRSSEPDLVIGTLQTREIIEVTDQYNRKNHTFLLTSIESADTAVTSTFNLVVQESSSGLFSYIVEYRPDEGWIPNYRDTQDFSTFSGEIIHYSITGRYIAKLNLIDGVAINGETRSPCSDDGNPNGDTENNGGNDGSPGPGDGSSGDSDGGGNGDNPPPDPDVSADLKWLCVWRQFLHNEPSECNNPSMGGSWVIVITYGDKSVEDTVRCPDDLPELPEVCYDDYGDPCPNQCDPSGNGCAEEPIETNPVVGIIHYDLNLIFDLNQYLEPDLTTEQIDWIFENEENVAFAEYALQILMANPDANPLIGADCRSFEYAQPPGAPQKGCAVTNFNHTFYTAGVRPNGSPYYGDIDVPIPTIYFTMPTWMTNGQAANLTAIAVTEAIKETDLYFYENPDISAYDLAIFFRNKMIANLAVVGGSLSTAIEPFPIPSPAPYITSILGLGNPFDC